MQHRRIWDTLALLTKLWHIFNALYYIGQSDGTVSSTGSGAGDPAADYSSGANHVLAVIHQILGHHRALEARYHQARLKLHQRLALLLYKEDCRQVGSKRAFFHRLWECLCGGLADLEYNPPLVPWMFLKPSHPPFFNPVTSLLQGRNP